MPIWLRFALFFVTLVILLVGANVYIHRRAARLLGLEKRGQWVLGAILSAGLILTVVGRAMASSMSDAVAEGVSVGGSAIQLGVIISLALLLPLELFGLARRIGGRLRRRMRPPAEPAPSELLLPRRTFLHQTATGAAMVVGGGSSAYGALFGRHDYQIEEVPLVLPNWPSTLDGYTIVQLSDIHFGTIIGEAELRAAIELVKKARPDAIVLTGDLVDHDERYAEFAGALVRRLEGVARDGVFAVPGNHDYYAGAEAVMSALTRGGAHVLFNSSRVIGDRAGAFGILGVDDLWSRRSGLGSGPDLRRALSMVPDDLPRVLLCHNPAFFPEASALVDLQLSGHTHGGQVNLLLRPADYVLPFGYVAGTYTRDSGTLYVNRGFGTAGPPSRVGAPPEVTRLIISSS